MRSVDAPRPPLTQPDQVAPHLLGVELAPGDVHVGHRDQLALPGPQRHPLGEHVVGVGEPLPERRLGAIGEADAVLVQQLAGAGVVGDDRPVRVEQVAVALLAVAAGHAR